ncbi:MAG TPA: HAD family hydrolase [Planctomycetota bacterium]|nr:HAD family hydrolase [Planctomycetota bacterium]
MIDDASLTVSAGGRGLPDFAVYRAIKMVVFDVDGVLTDSRIIIDSNGVESKFFSVRDGAGITFLLKAEIKVALLTGRSSAVVDFRAKELNIPPALVRQGAKVKLPVFTQLLEENGLTPAQAAFVGDDIIDLPVLEVAGLACCPADAHPSVKKICHVVSSGRGGRGGVRAIVEHFLQTRADGSWELALKRYLGRA